MQYSQYHWLVVFWKKKENATFTWIHNSYFPYVHIKLSTNKRYQPFLTYIIDIIIIRNRWTNFWKIRIHLIICRVSMLFKIISRWQRRVISYGCNVCYIICLIILTLLYIRWFLWLLIRWFISINTGNCITLFSVIASVFLLTLTELAYIV